MKYDHQSAMYVLHLWMNISGLIALLLAIVFTPAHHFDRAAQACTKFANRLFRRKGYRA